jgi:hypothetical protein
MEEEDMEKDPKKRLSELRLRLTNSFDYYHETASGDAVAAALLVLGEQLIRTEEEPLTVETGDLGHILARALHNIGCAVEKIGLAMEAAPSDA